MAISWLWLFDTIVPISKICCFVPFYYTAVVLWSFHFQINTPPGVLEGWKVEDDCDCLLYRHKTLGNISIIHKVMTTTN